MQILKQSTAVDVLIGPFVDITDGATAETGESPSVKLSKNGQTLAAKNDVTTPVHDADGYYNCELDTTDTNTVGQLDLTVVASANALPVFHRFQVVEEAIYDALFATSANGFDSSGNVAISAATQNSISDTVWDEAAADHITAGSMGANQFVARSGTAQAGAATTITLDASASSTNDQYNNAKIIILSGTGSGQGNRITDYDGGTKIATVQDTWATNPDATSVFQILPDGSLPGASAPTAAAIADAVWDEAMADHTSEGSYGTQLQSFHNGTAQAGTSSSLTLDATGSSSTDDFYNFAVIEIVAGTGSGQSRQISDYNGTTKVATVDPAWTTTPSTDSQYLIKGLGIDAATTASIADAVWDEARSGHVNAGSFGEYVLADALRVSGSAAAADGLEDAVSNTTPLPANVTQISGDAVAADNLESYTDGTTPMPVNATQISGDATAADNLEAALDGTGGVTFDADIEIRATGGTAGKNASELVTDILTTQMTEAYNTDGTAPTLAQALFVIMQRLTESEVSGTTLTVKQLDGSTTAYTLTLDDGTSPTSETRAT